MSESGESPATPPAAPTCPRCGGRLRSRSAVPLLLLPVVLGLGALLLVVLARGLLGPVKLLALVTAAFVILIAALGPLARAWLTTATCPRCRP